MTIKQVTVQTKARTINTIDKGKRMSELLKEGKGFDEALEIVRLENKEHKEDQKAQRKAYVRKHAKYVSQVSDFIGKDGKTNKVFQVWKTVDNVAVRAIPEISFGLSKARAIIDQINEVKKFVRDHS